MRSQLVVGTESGLVLVLDPSGSSILVNIQLPSAPSFMAVGGLFSVDYRIACACRDGNVYSIKNGELSGSVIELESLPVSLVRQLFHPLAVFAVSSILPAPNSVAPLHDLTDTPDAK